MTHELRIIEDSFTAPGETAWVTYRGKFNFCLSNPDVGSPDEFPTGVEIMLIGRFPNSVIEYPMRGVDGVVFSQPGVYVVDCPEPGSEFKLICLAVPGGTTVDYRLSR